MTFRVRIVPLIGITVLALAAPRPGHAQVHFGPQVNWASNDQGVGVGARVEASLAKAIPSAKGLGVIASFDFFFPSSGVTFWEMNANGSYHFEIPNVKFAPYAGVGLDVAHWSASPCIQTNSCGSASSTDFGLNLLAGTNFPAMGKITPFVEVRLELRTEGAFVVSGGVLF